MKKVLILSGIEWHDTFQRHQQFAIYLSKMGFEVYFIEHIISRLLTVRKIYSIFESKLNPKKNKTNKKLSKLPENVHLYNPRFYPPNFYFRIFNQSKIIKLIKEIGSQFDLVINYLPISTTLDLIEKLDYKKLVYDCVRDFEHFGGYGRKIIFTEKVLVAKADRIFTDSFFLTQKMKSLSNFNNVIQFLPVCTNAWLKGCTEAQKNIPQKIKKVAFFGTFGFYLDADIFDLLINNGFEVHFWGKASSQINKEIINHGFVYDLQCLAYEIVKTVDAIILPYKGAMDGVIPAKLIQCLATCLPVYISNFYDSLVLERFLYVYCSSNELLDLIKNYSVDDHMEKLVTVKPFVKEQTEEFQYKKFKNEIENLFK